MFLPTLPCLTPPLGGTPLEFLDETYPAKTGGMGLPYGEKFHNPNFNRFSIIQTDRQTDGRQHIRAIAYMLSRVQTVQIIQCKT